MNIVYEYGDLRSDRDKLLLNPVLPKEWKSLEFGVQVRGSIARVRMTPEKIDIRTVSGPAVQLTIWGADETVGPEGLVLPARVAD